MFYKTQWDSSKMVSPEGSFSWSPSTISLTWEGMPNFTRPVRVYSERGLIQFITYAGHDEVHLEQPREKYGQLLAKLKPLVNQVVSESVGRNFPRLSQYKLTLRSPERSLRLDLSTSASSAQMAIINLVNKELTDWSIAGFGTPSPDRK